MEMKRLVITLPAAAVGHVLNGYAGLNGYQAKITNEKDEEIDNPVTLEAFALGVLRDELLASAHKYNVSDQKKKAEAQILALAQTTASQLLPFVSLAIEDAV